MSFYALFPSGSYACAVGASATMLASNLPSTAQPGTHVYVFASNTDCWICQSDAGTDATVGAGSCFVAAGAVVQICASNGSHLSVLEDSSDGDASLTPLVASH
jgi:hypothetical protein